LPPPPVTPTRKVSVLLALGILVLPGIFIWFVLRNGYSVRARVLAIGWISVIFLTTQMLAASKNAGRAASAAATSSPVVAQASPAKPKAESPAAKKPAARPGSDNAEAEKRYLDMLDMSLEGARETGDIYHEDRPATSKDVSLGAMSADGTIYQEGSKITLSAAGKARQAAYRKEIGTIQAKAFPRLRLMHAKALDDALWELDIDAEATGRAYTTLRLTGYHFAANRNIKTVMDQIHKDVLASRFRRVEFHSYPGSATTWYDLDALPDTAIATLSFNRWTRVD
jgi:hypothetical protein